MKMDKNSKYRSIESKTARGSASKVSRSWTEMKHKSMTREIRLIMLAFAVATIVIGVWAYARMEIWIARLPSEAEKEAAETIRLIFLVLHIITGGVFLCLYLWAKNSPFPAMLLAFILFLTIQAVSFAAWPDAFLAFPLSLLLKVMILIGLGYGLRSAIIYKHITSGTKDG